MAFNGQILPLVYPASTSYWHKTREDMNMYIYIKMQGRNKHPIKPCQQSYLGLLYLLYSPYGAGKVGCLYSKGSLLMNV